MRRLGALMTLVLLIGTLENPGNSNGNDNGQEVCPNEDDGWVKFDDLDGFEFTYTPIIPDGFEIDTIKSCYKAGNIVEYGNSLTVVRDDDPELSHASFKVTFKKLPDVTVPTTPTTIPEEPTTTLPPEEPTTTIPEEPTTSVPPTIPPSIPPTIPPTPDTGNAPVPRDVVEPTPQLEELPFTGVLDWLPQAAFALLASGLLILRLTKRASAG